MAKKASIKQLLVALAQERGVEVTDVDKIYGGGGVKGRLEEGAGFGEAFSGAIEESVARAKKSVSKEGLKSTAKKAYSTFFGGDDIFSAYMRGRLNKRKSTPSGSPTREGADGGESGGAGISSDGMSFLKIIAKNSMSFHMMARDMNVMRQNLQKLVKIKAGPQKKGEKAYATGADAFFLKEDEKEAALEVQRQKLSGKPTAAGAPAPAAGGEGGGGFLDTIIGFFNSGFMSSIKKIFSPKMFGKIFSKVFLPITLIATLFSGIMDGWKRYQETGNLGDAIVAGLGGALNFLTFGLFGEDELKSLWSSVSDFLKPITDTIGGIFTDIKNFFVKLFGGKVEETGKSSGGKESIDKKSPNMPNPSDFISSAMKAGGESDEKIKDTQTLMGAMQSGVESGDLGSVVKAAKDYGDKYPQPVKAEAAVSSSPTAVSATDQIKDLETQKASLDKRLETRKRAMEGRKAHNLKVLSPEKAKIRNDNEDASFAAYKQDVEGAKAQIDSTIATLKASSASPTVSSGGSSPSGEVSGGGSAAPASGATPSGDSGQTAASGAEVSMASSDVAEAQRMESAADQGTVINSPTSNKNMSSQGKEASMIADAYDSELAKFLAPA